MIKLCNLLWLQPNVFRGLGYMRQLSGRNGYFCTSIFDVLLTVHLSIILDND